MKPRAFLLASLFAMMGCASQTHSQEPRLIAVDEGAKDLSWTSFRAKLLTALEKRDRKFVLGVIDPKVRNGADAPAGIEEFRKQWEFDQDDGVFWRQLPATLSVGSAWLDRGKKQPRELCAPYVLAKWPRETDPGVYGAIATNEAWVKAGPAWESATVTKLSYQIVRVLDWEVPDIDPKFQQKWVRIRLLKEGTGYVPEEHIRSPIEHAACFVKAGASWRMTVFGPAARD